MSARLHLCFPYRDVGGVPLLFLRLAAELGRRGADVSLVDYEDGYMARRRDARTMKLVTYPLAGSVGIPADTTLVLQAMTPWSIFPRLAPARGTRLLFWNCHPFNLVPTFPGLRRFMMGSERAGQWTLRTVLRPWRARMRRFAMMLLERDSLVFMDHTNVRTTERQLDLRIDHPPMLAIPAESSDGQPHAPPQVGTRGLRVAWVGRIVDFKFHALLHAMRRLDALQPSLGVRLSLVIIGAGDYETQLRDAAARLPRLDVHFHGEVEPDDLKRLLADEVDLLLAMGTSALEGARLGVPTLLLDLSYRPIEPATRIGWLHENDGYSLADMAQPCPVAEADSALDLRLRELLADPRRVSEAARAYFNEHHDIAAIATQLLAYAGRARCTWGELQDSGQLRRGALYGLFSRMRDGGRDK